MKRIITLAVAFLTFAGLGADAQDKVVKKTIELGTTDNRTMYFEDYLSNVIGGRIVGSHNLEDAEKWVANQFRSWGLDVVVQEVGEINVGFSRGPWSGRMLSGEGMTLHFGTPSYTAGTKGPQVGHVVKEAADARDFERRKATFKGAWVLVGGASRGFPVDTASVPMFYQMIDAGALGFIQAAEVPMQIHYDRKNCFNLTMDSLPKVCDIKLDKEQYDYIMAKVNRMEKVELEFNIRNNFFEGPVKYHNILGIIKGSKYPDEYVITGGHLDAYDSATGSVDDAQGVSVTMESARLLALSGAKPKRSIMFSIWTAEEYGLYGSKHFVESNMVPMNKVSNYFNRDAGPEVAVGVTVIPSMYDDFKKICEPLETLNEEFPFTVSRKESAPGPKPTTAGGSDHAYFAMNGVPTVSLDLKDVRGYNFNYREIWHTDKDLFNMVYPDYLEHSSIVNAVVVYGVANLDHLLSRDGLYSE